MHQLADCTSATQCSGDLHSSVCFFVSSDVQFHVLPWTPHQMGGDSLQAGWRWCLLSNRLSCHVKYPLLLASRPNEHPDRSQCKKDPTVHGQVVSPSLMTKWSGLGVADFPPQSTADGCVWTHPLHVQSIPGPSLQIDPSGYCCKLHSPLWQNVAGTV